MQLQDSVQCKVSGVVHKIIKHPNDQEFGRWSNSILERLAANQKILLAVDCEGWGLGSNKNSLGMIQIAECFQPNFLNSKIALTAKKEKISINLKPGFLITTFSSDVVNSLTNIFCHLNTTLVMFDITSDLTAMEEVGICFRYENIVDCQCQNKIACKINSTRCSNLKNTCQKARNCVEYEAVVGEFAQKVSTDWGKLFYIYRDEEKPFEKICGTILNYASSDIALTAVSLIGALDLISPKTLRYFTSLKFKEYKTLKNNFGKYGAAMKRQIVFMTRSLNQANSKKQTPNEKNVYRIWDSAKRVLENYDLYAKMNKKLSSKDTIQKIYNTYSLIIEEMNL